jgi:hypothetical protein
MPDFIPFNDADFRALGHKMVTGGTGHEPALGITVGQLTTLNDALEDCDNASAAVTTAETAYNNAIVVRNAARAVAEPQMRTINRLVQAKLGATGDDLKTNMGLPLHDTTPSRAPAPTIKPVLMVDTSERLQHKITFRDETTPKSRAKPAGVSDIEIWCKIGAPAPADFNDCVLVITSPKNCVVVTCKGADAGKPAHYMARWKSTRGEFGPWSETVVASIGA